MLKNSFPFHVLIITLFISSSSCAKETLSNLDTLEWKNRIILIKSNNQCMQTVEVLLKNNFEIDDRNIVWFVFCESNQRQLISNYEGTISQKIPERINQQYFNSVEAKADVVLIGKDGGVKYKAEQLNLDTINQRIDSMPMRLDEMRQREMRK